tara:strand:+ start:5240 stop:5878 length:639 start_codon:yes stop_codon:yes gene_type:complete
MDSEIPIDIDHAKHSVGGSGGHWFRRLTHVSMAIIPFSYHLWGDDISAFFSLSLREFVTLVGVAFIIIETIRIRLGIIIVGQREYESNQISALAWGAFAVCATLLLAPQDGDGLNAGKYTIPIILGLTFVDPLMGEVKRSKAGLKKAIFAGLMTSYLIWLTSVYFFSTPLIYAIILAPLTVLGEIPTVRWIDDNATMIIFPLVVVLLFDFLF